jgi:hypothetical protein
MYVTVELNVSQPYPIARGSNFLSDYAGHKMLCQCPVRMLLLTYKRHFPILIPTKIEFAAYYEKLGYVGLVDDYKDKDWKPVTISGRVLREMYIIG